MVPYIAELVGYRPVPTPASRVSRAPIRTVRGAGSSSRGVRSPTRSCIGGARARWPLLEALANDIAGWPAGPLSSTRTARLESGAQSSAPGPGPNRRRTSWRSAGSCRQPVRPSWPQRRRASRQLAKDRGPAQQPERRRVRVAAQVRTGSPRRRPSASRSAGPHSFTFSVLGNDAPLYLKPEPETELTHIAEELNLPVPIRRAAAGRTQGSHRRADARVSSSGPASSEARP